MANVIEVVGTFTDNISSPLRGVGATLDRVSGLFSATALVGGTLAATFALLVKNADDALEADVKLEGAIRRLGAQARITTDDVNELAGAIQSTTSFDDESIKNAASSLLLFNRVTGETFKEALTLSADLAQVMGSDVASAATTLGRALLDPERGLRQLRVAGVVFTDDQRELLKQMMDTGREADAQRIILDRLEEKMKGAAQESRATLGGALASLRNNFLDLLEGGGSQGPLPAVVAKINELTDALANLNAQDAAGQKSNTATGLSLLGKAVDVVLTPVTVTTNALKELWAILGRVSARSDEFLRNIGINPDVGALIRQIDTATDAPAPVQSDRRGVIKGREPAQPAAPAEPPFQFTDFDLEAIVLAGQKATDERLKRDAEAFKRNQEEVQARLEERARALEEMNNSTRTAVDAEIAQYQKLLASVDELLKARVISEEEAARRRTEIRKNAALTTATEVEREAAEMQSRMDQIQAQLAAGIITPEMYEKRLEELTNELMVQIEIPPAMYKNVLEQLDEPYKEFTDSIKRAFDGMLRTGMFSGKQLINFLIAEFARKELFKAIDNMGAALGKALSGSSGGGFLSGVAKGLGTLFGFSAGGGSVTRPRIVGEEGPELFLPGASGRIMNKRQMAFAGAGGAALSYSPVTNITVQGSADEQAIVALNAEWERKRRADQLGLLAMLERNGLGRMR